MQHEQLLPIAKLEKKVGFSRSKVYRLIREEAFPPGRMIQNQRMWRESDIDAWIEAEWQKAS